LVLRSTTMTKIYDIAHLQDKLAQVKTLSSSNEALEKLDRHWYDKLFCGAL